MDHTLAPSLGIASLGPILLLPCLVFLMTVVLGTKPGRAFRAALTIGVAFVGINLVLWLLATTLGEVALGLERTVGLRRDVVDVGWPSAAAIAFGTSVGLWVIPISIAVNLLLLALRLTRTLDVDVWNFWHFAFVGSLVTAATDHLGYGLAAAALMSALSLMFADWTAKGVQRFFGVPGVSAPHLAAAQVVPIAIVLNWMMDRIPVVDRLHVDADRVQKRLGLFGEPMLLGLGLGLGLGTLAFFDADSPAAAGFKILQTGVTLAAATVLLPRILKILMEGLIPVTEAAQTFAQKRLGERDLHVGLDAAVLVGHPSAVAASLILVPIAILLSLILPGNRVILFADLSVIPFLVAMAAPIVNGNVVRMVIVGAVTLTIGFYVGTALSPWMTVSARDAGFALPDPSIGIISVVDGFLYVTYLVVEAVARLGLAGLALVAAVVLALMFGLRMRPARWERLAGAGPDDRPLQAE